MKFLRCIDAQRNASCECFITLADTLRFERPAGNEARMVLAVAEDPRLSDWAVWQRGIQELRQTALLKFYSMKLAIRSGQIGLASYFT